MYDLERLAERLRQSRYAIALTGAGISVESGIPDFRSKNGLWSRFDPMEFAHIDSFRADPQKIWKMLFEMDVLVGNAKPNAAHYALAALESMCILKAVVTQNIDSLHQRAGSVNVIEFHGHGRTLRCDRCRKKFDRMAVSLERLPPLCSCGSSLRPEIVFFGEDIPMEAYRQAMAATRRCDFMFVVGTSATVAPASFLPRAAKDNGAFLLEVNLTKTQLTENYSDMHIAESAAVMLPAILAQLNSNVT